MEKKSNAEKEKQRRILNNISEFYIKSSPIIYYFNYEKNGPNGSVNSIYFII